MDRTHEPVAQARAELEEAYQAWQATWGPIDAGQDGALPRAVQLEARIAAGEIYVKEHPNDRRAVKHLAQLRRRLTQARSDPDDRLRCQEWYAARRRFEAAERRYLETREACRQHGSKEIP